MMAKEQDERTPLIRSTPSNGPRRRVPQSSLSDTTNVVVSPSFQDNDKDDDDDTNKNEKRFFGQSLITFCQSRKAAHDERFHDARYYEDDVNDFSWECSFGTSHGNGIWLNRKDKGGMLMALIVWILVVYCGMSVTLLAATSKHLSYIIAAFHNTICFLALASHAKCMCTDPGAIPPTAVPPLHVQAQTSVHAMCRYVPGEVCVFVQCISFSLTHMNVLVSFCFHLVIVNLTNQWELIIVVYAIDVYHEWIIIVLG
jgi:hypothetical protein